MLKTIGNILFIIAGTIWGIELIPQIVKTIYTKKVNDISIFFISLSFIAYIIFLIGSFLTYNWFLFFAHLFPITNVGILLFLILKYKK